MTGKKEKRKRAYQYLAFIAEKYLGAPPNFSHKKLAEMLDIPISELNSLKQGRSDPSPELIAALKSLLGKSIPGEFDSHLVTPFLTSS